MFILLQQDLKKMAASKRYQNQASQSIRMHDVGEVDVKYYIKLPPKNSHTNHTTGEVHVYNTFVYICFSCRIQSISNALNIYIFNQ